MTVWDELVEIITTGTVIALAVCAYIATIGLVVWGICQLAGWA